MFLLQANGFLDDVEKVTTQQFALKFSEIILHPSKKEHFSNHSPLRHTHHSLVLSFSPTSFQEKNLEHGGKFNHPRRYAGQCALRDKTRDCVTKAGSVLRCLMRSDKLSSCSSY